MSPEFLESLPKVLFAATLAYAVSAFAIHYSPFPFELKPTVSRLPTPLLKQRDDENQFLIVRWMIPILVSWGFAAFFEPSWAFMLPTGVAIWTGLRVRAHLAKEVWGPTFGYIWPWTIRRPMLLFDLFTAGIAGMFLALGLFIRWGA